MVKPSPMIAITRVMIATSGCEGVEYSNTLRVAVCSNVFLRGYQWCHIQMDNGATRQRKVAHLHVKW